MYQWILFFYPTEWREYDSDILTETKKKHCIIESSYTQVICITRPHLVCELPDPCVQSAAAENVKEEGKHVFGWGKNIEAWNIWGFNIEHFFSTSFCSILPAPFLTHHPRRIAINYIIKKTYQTFSGKTEQNYINMLMNHSCWRKKHDFNKNNFQAVSLRVLGLAWLLDGGSAGC